MEHPTPTPPSLEVTLRDVEDSDLPIFFAQQQDPTARWMAAFTSQDPADRAAFDAHWTQILADPTTTNQTILVAGAVAGNIACFPWEGRPDIGYWIGREYWGRGIATQALAAFLRQIPERPLYAAAAKDNAASIRVLEKCGFTLVGESTGFANARGAEIAEVSLILRAPGDATGE